MGRTTKCLLAAIVVMLAGTPALAQEKETSEAQDAAAAPDLGFHGDAAVLGRLTDVSGDREKFEEYGTVRDEVVLDHLQLSLQGGGRAEFLELDLGNVGQDDERYRVALGRHGRYELALSYTGIPHRYASGTFLWGGFGHGRLLIPDVVQGQLAASEQTGAERSGTTPVTSSTDPNLDTTGEDAAQQAIVRDLYGSADRVSFAQQRRQAGAELTYELTRDARAWVRVSNENRSGTRVLSAGTYERWNVGSGAAHTQDRFFTSGAELAEPIDYRTFAATAGAGIQKRGWLADVEYTFTNFRNFEDALRWDNPFRITDATQVAGGFDRGRFVVGQVVLPPNSLSHDATASGAVDLPLDGRLALSLSFGRISQDEQFEPYTQNTAITATNVPGTPSAATLARPVSNLDGDVRTLAANVSATVRPLHPVALGARYRFYRYDAKSEQVVFPGYAAFGESAWRTVKNDKNAPVKNEVFDYTRQEGELSADVHLSRMLSLAIEGDWEGWTFEHLRLDGMNEYGVGAGLTIKPARTASLKLSYRFADRSIDGYLKGRTEENPEATGLINYNWAERTRHQAQARLQVLPSELVSVGVMARFLDDDYGGETEGGTVADQFRFGRSALRAVLGAADVTLTPGERLSLTAGYSREYRKEEMQSAAKDDAVKSVAFLGIEDDYSPANYWNSDITETVDSVNLDAAVQLVPERLLLDLSYILSFSDMEVDTSNPNGVVAGTTLGNAVAQDWPEIRSRLHEVIGDVAFPFTRNVRAGARYLFSWYDLDDFAWDQMQPYMAGRSVENTTRFLFADANYGGYRAHVGSVYVAGRF
jgi:MtrB/PioB family decaheme-associated outer membrane protein